ncbi:MAG: DUF6498-containing protein [Rhabdaerophilum sp.]
MMFAANKGHRPVMLSLAALLLVNMLPVFGVLFFGWSVFDVMVLFWLENVVIGLFNVLRMGTRLVLMRDWIALFLIPFFSFHYGAFCAGHGLFVLALFGQDMQTAAQNTGMSPFGLFRMVAALLESQPGFFWAAIGLIASHFVSYVVNFLGRSEFRRIDAGELMHAPYKRIVILHVAIILGAIAVASLGQPIYALLILIGLKVAIDAVAHLNERQRLSAQEAPVASPSTIRDRTAP